MQLYVISSNSERLNVAWYSDIVHNLETAHEKTLMKLGL